MVKTNIYKNMDQEDIEELERFRALMKRGFSADPWARVGGRPADFDSEELGNDTDSENTVSDYKNNIVNPVAMLEEVGTASDKAVQQLIEASSLNPEIAEALETTVSNDGVIIGKWRISVNTKEYRGKKKKNFSVSNIITGQMIAKKLCIYEAALALVRYLNQGKSIRSTEIHNLLELEKKYYSHRVDSLTYKVNALKAAKFQDHSRVSVLETRQKESEAKALLLENEIRTISNSIL